MSTATSDRHLPTTVDATYAADRARVDTAYRHLRAVTNGPHQAADACRAVHELAEALREARAAATRGLQAAASSSVVKRRRHRPARRASRAVAPAVRPWAAELVRLAEIGVWMRAATADELGVLAPTTVRVGSRAATGPHIAGMEFEPDSLVAETLYEPRIGVDLAAVLAG